MSHNRTRSVAESPIERGVNEEYAYSFLLTDRLPAGTYANATNELYEKDANGRFVTAVSDWNDGSPSVDTTTYTSSRFVAGVIEDGQDYRLYCAMEIDGDVWDWNVMIKARL